MVVFYGLLNFLLVIGTGTTRRQPRVVPGYNAGSYTQASSYTHKLVYCLSLIHHFTLIDQVLQQQQKYNLNKKVNNQLLNDYTMLASKRLTGG